MDTNKPEKFSGNVLFNFTGVILLVSSIMLIWVIKVLANADNSAPWWIFIVGPIPSLLFIAVMTNRLFYFRVSDDTLEIRNQVLLWYSYMAASLRRERWQALADTMQKRNIPTKSDV
jgi:hypothetical protein